MGQNDLYPVNGWLMELPGLTSPAFHKLQGLSKKTGLMTTVDGGTNVQLSFSDGIVEHGPVTLVRTRDGSANDNAFAAFFAEAVKGKKLNGVMTQKRNGVQIMKIMFTGCLFNEYSLTDFDTNGKGDSAKSDQKAVAQVEGWEEV